MQTDFFVYFLVYLYLPDSQENAGDIILKTTVKRLHHPAFGGTKILVSVKQLHRPAFGDCNFLFGFCIKI